ncbi:uncharacterized protein BJ171DRAFT_628632 [Polychytrium aggregatum]|uniref:uncharacterized protein n=1 Tax=Polychytrium aggregatum TaxID=110093 RepID=UPI0022FF0F8A|nr:uncharacterized protein BJ171DRAFT_628632 [Polychytrium aggregatum]KAI9202225.1 hypothetical protein BJ171DRAFT_628632 [Polychytrium aggregatum]
MLRADSDIRYGMITSRCGASGSTSAEGRLCVDAPPCSYLASILPYSYSSLFASSRAHTLKEPGSGDDRHPPGGRSQIVFGNYNDRTGSTYASMTSKMASTGSLSSNSSLYSSPARIRSQPPSDIFHQNPVPGADGSGAGPSVLPTRKNRNSSTIFLGDSAQPAMHPSRRNYMASDIFWSSSEEQTKPSAPQRRGGRMVPSLSASDESLYVPSPSSAHRRKAAPVGSGSGALHDAVSRTGSFSNVLGDDAHQLDEMDAREHIGRNPSSPMADQPAAMIAQEGGPWTHGVRGAEPAHELGGYSEPNPGCRDDVLLHGARESDSFESAGSRSGAGADFGLAEGPRVEGGLVMASGGSGTPAQRFQQQHYRPTDIFNQRPPSISEPSAFVPRGSRRHFDQPASNSIFNDDGGLSLVASGRSLTPRSRQSDAMYSTDSPFDTAASYSRPTNGEAAGLASSDINRKKHGRARNAHPTHQQHPSSIF